MTNSLTRTELDEGDSVDAGRPLKKSRKDEVEDSRQSSSKHAHNTRRLPKEPWALNRAYGGKRSSYTDSSQPTTTACMREERAVPPQPSSSAPKTPYIGVKAVQQRFCAYIIDKYVYIYITKLC